LWFMNQRKGKTCDFMNPKDCEEMAAKTELRAFIVGYTGQIGQKLVDELASKSFTKVNLIGRREVEEFKTEKYSKCVQYVVDFDDLASHSAAFEGSDVGFCALGTTRGKSGVEGFKKIDFDYVLSTAKVAHGAGAREFHLVSSQGANKDSSFLYPQTKGLIEEAVAAVGFNRLFIYRPAFLVEAKRSETRIGEILAHVVTYPIVKLFPTAISVPIGLVAKAMAAVAEKSQELQSDQQAPLKTIYDNKQIHQIAQGEIDPI